MVNEFKQGTQHGNGETAFDSLYHLTFSFYFKQYSMLPCELGDVVEIGSGAYTQLRSILERARGLKKQCQEGLKVA